MQAQSEHVYVYDIEVREADGTVLSRSGGTLGDITKLVPPGRRQGKAFLVEPKSQEGRPVCVVPLVSEGAPPSKVPYHNERYAYALLRTCDHPQDAQHFVETERGSSWCERCGALFQDGRWARPLAGGVR